MNDFEHYPKAIRDEIEQMVLTEKKVKKKKRTLYNRIKLCTKILINKASK